MKSSQAALYARVSSEQQSEAKTIESQIADLRSRIAAAGMAPTSGASHNAAIKSSPVTMAVTPLRPPAATPAELSI